MFCQPDGTGLDDVHVGVQVRRDPTDLISAGATEARWCVDVDVIEADGVFDFRGPAVQGRRGDRFVYLTWGNVGVNGEFEMFRRAKLMLNRVDSGIVRAGLDWAVLSRVST